MGVVYRGYDPVLDREIALKIIELPTSLDPERRKRFLERFLLEAKIAGKLIHPNIVVTHDAATDESSETPFIAMELVSGESLHARLGRGRIEWGEALSLAEPLAKALDYAHQADVVHRDIKPANILLTSKGVPKIADFGIAKLPNSQLTLSGTVMGTPYFMSPEQLQGADVDGRSDVFSLGALLYNLLTGVPPFRGNDLASITQQVLYKSPTPPSELVEGIPVDVDGVLARAMAKNAEDRYQSAEELASDLARVRQGDSPQKPLSFGEKTQESTLRRAEPEQKTPGTATYSRGCFSFTFPSLFLAAIIVAGAAFSWDDVSRFLELLREQQREGERREVVKTEASSLLAEASDLLERGHFDHSRTFTEKALALSRDAKDGEGEATALLELGRLEAERGAWSKARADLEASASVFAIYDHAEGRATAIWNWPISRGIWEISIWRRRSTTPPNRSWMRRLAGPCWR
jgi:serine/threonine protein kinase